MKRENKKLYGAGLLIWMGFLLIGIATVSAGGTFTDYWSAFILASVIWIPSTLIMYNKYKKYYIDPITEKENCVS
jgi:hypothetical protein